MRINIIGAGPIGGQAAYLLAKKGFEVHLYEEHSAVGKPVQCTGLMTVSLNDVLVPTKEFLVNTTERVEVFSPNGGKAEFKSKEYIVDRTLFDSFLVNRALDAGAIIHNDHRFIGMQDGKLLFRDKKKNEAVYIDKSVTIGADGPLSEVAKTFGLYGTRTFFYGIQARVSSRFDAGSYQAYFGNDIAPGLFAWVVPESDSIARVGLGARQNAHAYFEKFMKKNNYTAIDIQAGPIPIYDPKLRSFDVGEQVYLIGDAAAQVKATTLGGLIPGLKTAECLAEAIANGLDYEMLWKKNVGRNLWLHLQARKAMDRFSDSEWDKVVRLIGQHNIKRAFEKYDREHPFKLLPALLKEPRLWWLGRHLVLRG